MRSSIVFLLLLIQAYSFGQNEINWQSKSEVAASTFGNNFPRIEKDGDGNPLVSWSDDSDMFLARWNGTGFTTPVKLNTNGVSVAGPGWMGPDLAAQGDTVYAVYKQTPAVDTLSHIWCVRSFDGGVTFDQAVRVDYIGAKISRFPTVAIDGQGHPVIGFMEYEADLTEPQWVVVRSNDHGSSFTSPVLASRWSSNTAEVCDCCPTKIVAEGSRVALPYRDNNSDIRDIWVGVSDDGGATIPSGMAVDQLNWSVKACPSSGPDAVIVGDYLYTTFMNGANKTRVYYSVSSLTSVSDVNAIPLDHNTPLNLVAQNFPRVDYHDGAMAFVWKQFSNGSNELAIQFTANISNGMNTVQEIVDSKDIEGVDVLVHDGTVWVIWEDEAAGVIRYRKGTYTKVLGMVSAEEPGLNLEVYPNPSSGAWQVSGTVPRGTVSYELLSASGKSIDQGIIELADESFSLSLANGHLESGVYLLRISNGSEFKTVKLMRL